MWPGKSYDIPPQLQAGRAQSELFTFNAVNESSIETAN